jgi:hypothetical protein
LPSLFNHSGPQGNIDCRTSFRPTPGTVSVRLHHGGPQGAKPKGEVVADILASIKERRA